MKPVLIVALLLTVLTAQIELPHHFQSSFTQIVTNPKQKVITYSGKIFFMQKDRFKWVYLKPTRKEVCTDGEELLVVDHDLEQVSAYRMSQALDISTILAQAKHHKERIYVTRYEGKQYTIQLDAQKRLQSIAYFDDLDNKVQIVFEHMQYENGSVTVEKMQCNYPAVYDVIRG